MDAAGQQGLPAAFAVNTDGSAKDPRAFQDALRENPSYFATIQQDPELSGVLLGEDIDAFQALLREVFAVRVWALCGVLRAG